MKTFFIKYFKPIFLKYLDWKYRNIDPNICCCGSNMNESKAWDSVCNHGGCRSAKEYAITNAVEKFSKS
jgi:hypothetical protein